MDNEQYKKLSEIAREIINFSRSRIILNFRFFDVPLSRITFVEDLDSFYCNGKFIIYNPEFITKAFETSEVLPLRIIIHSLMHCILGHVYAFGSSFEEVELWNACCDISVEALILDLLNQNIYLPTDDKKKNFIYDLNLKVKKLMADKLFEAALSDPHLKTSILNNADLFKMDDHTYWYDPLDGMKNDSQNGDSNKNKDSDKENNDSKNQNNKNSDEENKENNESSSNEPSQGNDNKNKQEGFTEKAKNPVVYYNKDQEQQEDWQNISDRMITEIEDFAKGIGTAPGELINALKANAKEEYDYETFLKKFAHVHEAMMINDEEFDYVLYTYGLSLYKNMPIIEPLEYKDKKLLKTFIIAIDTSGSTYGDLVEKFLRKTFNILKDCGMFTKRCEIRIVQCDARVQHVDIVHNLKEIDKMFSNFQIYGGGGTSFIPVFSYVDKLIKDKEIGRLDGLIYFTDGQGEFPRKKPSYRSAFVFVEHDEYDWNNYDIPSWAIKLIINEKELK